MKKPLFKTTAVIWSETNPVGVLELSNIATQAEEGFSYCSSMVTEMVKEPEDDPDWDGTEFFSESDADTSLASLLRRAAAGFETPGDLSEDDKTNLTYDLLNAADDLAPENPDPDKVIDVKLLRKAT